MNEEFNDEDEGEGVEEREDGTEDVRLREGPSLAEDIANIVSGANEGDGVGEGDAEGDYRSPGYSTMYAQLYSGTDNNTVVTGIYSTYKRKSFI